MRRGTLDSPWRHGVAEGKNALRAATENFYRRGAHPVGLLPERQKRRKLDFRRAALNRNHSRMFAQKRPGGGAVSGKKEQAKHTGSLFARAGKAVPVQDGAAALPSKAARCLQVKAAG